MVGTLIQLWHWLEQVAVSKCWHKILMLIAGSMETVITPTGVLDSLLLRNSVSIYDFGSRNCIAHALIAAWFCLIFCETLEQPYISSFMYDHSLTKHALYAMLINISTYHLTLHVYYSTYLLLLILKTPNHTNTLFFYYCSCYLFKRFHKHCYY